MANRQAFWSSPKGVAALVMIAAVTYFLLMEHREHLFQALPYLIFLMCPLMHLFMHRGHHHHHHHGSGSHRHHPDQRGQEKQSEENDNDR